jgi:hypothetical protein
MDTGIHGTAETRADPRMRARTAVCEGSTQGGTFETYSVNNIYNPQYSIHSVDQYNRRANVRHKSAPVPEIVT